MQNFKKLGLSDETIEVLKNKGYKEPTPIQEKTIPVLLEGKLDVIGKAQTGTGKTACFALPIIETIDEHDRDTQAIVLAPTRELAIQVSEEIDSLKGNRRLKVLSVYGGSSIMNQINALKRGVQIVVGTPGRVMDLMERKKLDISNISFAVLDEADEMLNMGFVDDIKKILSNTNPDKRMLLFSATMPREIQNIATRFMREHVLIEVEDRAVSHELTEQIYYNIKSTSRYEGIRRILTVNDDFYGIVFCRTKAEVDQVAKKLVEDNYPAAAIHGDFSQGQRENVFSRFKSKKITILVATDVAARGLDVNDLTHVINYSMPRTTETYVHRIGRTGRAGKKGVAITFVMPSEQKQFASIKRLAGEKLQRKELPAVSEVIEMKRSELLERIKKILEKGNTKKYDLMAEELLKESTPHLVVAAVLKYAFQKELDPNSYKDIAKVEEKVMRERRDGRSDRRPRTRNGRDRPRRGNDSRRRDDRSRGYSGKSRDGRSRDDRSRGKRSRDDKDKKKFSDSSEKRSKRSRGVSIKKKRKSNSKHRY